jgi:hypothetical protein
MKMFNYLKKLLLPLALLCAMAVPGIAQTIDLDPQPIPIGAVDPATLNVNVTIPIVSKSGLVPFSTSLVFNNNFWKWTGSGLTYGWFPVTGQVGKYLINYGWNLTDSLAYGMWNNYNGLGCPLSSDGTTPQYYKSYIDASGESHPLPHATAWYIGTGTNATCPPYTSYTVQLTDGSGLTAHLNAGGGTYLVTSSGATIAPSNFYDQSGSYRTSLTDVNNNVTRGHLINSSS